MDDPKAANRGKPDRHDLGVGVTLDEHLQSVMRLVQQAFHKGMQYEGSSPVYIVNYLVGTQEPQHATTVVVAESPSGIQRQIAKEIRAEFGHVYPSKNLVRPVPRTRPQMRRQKHRTRARRLFRVILSV